VPAGLTVVAVGAAAPYFYRGRRGRYARQFEGLAEEGEGKETRLLES